MINRRMAYIKSKGFDMTTKDDLYSSINQDFVPTDFSKIRVGAKYLSDAVLKLGDLKRVNPNLVDKKIVYDIWVDDDYIIHEKNIEVISN